MSLFNAPTTKIHMLPHDWKRIEVLINNTETIANFLYPPFKQRADKNKPLRPKDKAFQWARYTFMAAMGSALVKTEQVQGKDILEVYLLSASAPVLIQAMDAVLSTKALGDKVYSPIATMDTAALCSFIEPVAKEEEEADIAPAYTPAMAVDGDLIKEFNRQLTNSTTISALRNLV